MDALLEQARDVFEGCIDFGGQAFTEFLSNFMLIVVSVLALFIGFIVQDIHLTMWLLLGGTLITLLVVVPAWPYYNRHPEPWLGSRLRAQTPHKAVTQIS